VESLLARRDQPISAWQDRRMSERLLPRELRVLFGHTTLVLLLVTAGYYVLPFRFGQPSDGSACWSRS
jgi:hypothetical protein